MHLFQSRMHVKVLRKFNGFLAKAQKIICIIPCLLWLLAILAQVNSSPFVSECSASFILRISCVFQCWLEVQALLVFIFKMRIDLTDDRINFLL